MTMQKYRALEVVIRLRDGTSTVCGVTEVQWGDLKYLKKMLPEVVWLAQRQIRDALDELDE